MAVNIQIEKKLGDFHLQARIAGDSKRIGILGASGCGKSMTLKCIAGIENPDSGYIEVDESCLFHSDRKINCKPQKRRVGYLFQNYALFPTMTVSANIAAGLKGSREKTAGRVEEMVRKFRLEGLEKRLPGELSGGQQQRVALARIMAYEPKTILLDEPFSALDGYLKDRLQQEMMEMLEDYPGTVILVSHSRDEIYRFSDELVIMDGGKTICQGRTKDVFADPGWREAAKLTGCKNLVPAEREDVHTLRVPDWQTRLTFRREVPEEIRYIGVRAHDFVPVWEERERGEESACGGRIAVCIGSMAELPFERKYFLKSCGEEDICWFVQREQWEALDRRGLPKWLDIPEDKVLLLK